MPDVIPLSAPWITDDDRAAVDQILRGPTLSGGAAIEQLEQAFCERFDMPHACAVNSGTAALHIGMMALGIGTGDEVITTAFTVPAVANAIIKTGAQPVFADIDADGNLSPETVEPHISNKTKAILMVYIAGRPANTSGIKQLADRHGLRLIEDTCEAIGGEHNGQSLGSFGDCSVFAFYPNKQITCGEGGLLLCKDSKVAEQAKRARNHGRSDNGQWADQLEWGFNYRLTSMQAALCLSQLQRLNKILQMRETLAICYNDLLRNAEKIQRPELTSKHGSISWFIYSIQLNGLDETARDTTMAKMLDKGIQCGRYFAPLYRQPYFKKQFLGDEVNLPNTHTLAENSLSLPFFTTLSKDQQQNIVECLLTQLRN